MMKKIITVVVMMVLLTAALFAESQPKVTYGKVPGIATVEYKESTYLVTFNPEDKGKVNDGYFGSVKPCTYIYFDVTLRDLKAFEDYKFIHFALRNKGEDRIYYEDIYRVPGGYIHIGLRQ